MSVGQNVQNYSMQFRDTEPFITYLFCTGDNYGQRSITTSLFLLHHLVNTGTLVLDPEAQHL